jgi:hypothetical protein
MKTATTTAPIIASSELEGSLMGMDAKGMDMATYFFRDKIYNNKVEAVVREYVCNAIDENKKFNVDTPVAFGLRGGNNGTTEFFVRDNANGLDEDGVRKIFGMYFRSTKSTTNESIGGFGVGSKAGHAYTDTFNIISYHKGEKTTYTCALGGGENGVDVGQIYKLDSEPTTESGIEINLEVKCNDFPFECFKYMNSSHENIEFHHGSTVYKRNEIVLEEQHGQFTFRVTKPHFPMVEKCNYQQQDVTQRIHLKMGDVSYGNLKKHSDRLKEIKVNDGYTVSVEFPIGSLDIPVSRESIRDTPKNLKLIKKSEEAFDTFLKETFKDLTNLSTPELVAKVRDNRLTDKENGEDNRDGKLKSKYFSTSYSGLLGDMGLFAQNLINNSSNGLRSLSGAEVCDKTQKPLLVLIPNKQSQDYWVSVLKDVSNLTGKNWFAYKKGKWQKSVIDTPEIMEAIEKDFVIIDPKKLPRNKFKGVKGIKQPVGKYVVKNNGMNLPDRHDPLSLHNWIMEQYGEKPAKTLEAAQKQISKIKKNLNLTKIRMITLAQDSTRQYSRGYTGDIHVGAKALLKGMIELGYWTPTTDAFLVARDKQLKIKNRQSTIDNVISSVTYKNVLWLSDKSKKLCQKNDRNKARFTDMILKLSEHDNALVSRFVKTLTKHTWHNEFSHIDRSDLRYILRRNL